MDEQFQDEVTLESLQGVETDPEREKKVAQSTQLKAGWYNSTPELSLTLGRAKASGRPYARFFGQFNGVGELSGEAGKASFAVSWQENFNQETGKADMMSRLWLAAKRTYTRAMGIDESSIVTVAAVLEFVQKYQVAVRFIQGDEDNLAVQISQARQ